MVRAKSPTVPRFCLIALFVATLAAAPLAFAAGPLIDPLSAPEWQPAQLPFAGELAGGPVRVLLIAPARTLRDGVELARRLPLRLDVVPIAQIEQEPTSLGDALGNQPDVIVLANFDFNRLPEPALADIATRSANGAGLILIQRHAELPDTLRTHLETLVPLDDVGPLTRGTGLELIPEWREEYAFVDARANDTTRALEITYLADLPTFHCLIPAPPGRAAAEPLLLDSYFTTPARAVLWAGKRESQTWIAAIEEIRPPGPDADEVPPFLPEPFIESQQRAASLTPLATYRISLNQPADDGYRLRTRVRYPYRDIAWHTEWEAPWRKGEQTFDLQLPSGSGLLLLDIWLEKRRSAVDWFTLAQDRPGLPSIESFLIPRRVLQPIDTVEIALRIGPHVGPQPGPVTVLARAKDALGRVVGQRYQNAPATAADIAVPLQITGAMGGFVKVEAFVLAANPPFETGQLERATHQWTYLPLQRPYDTGFAVWADGAAMLELTPSGYNEQLAELGVDTIHHAYPFDFPDGIAWTPLHVAPAMPAAAALAWRLPCLLTEPYLDGLRDTAAQWAAVASAGYVLPASGYGPIAPDALLHDGRACAKDFVDFLVAGYGDYETFQTHVQPGADNWEQILETWNQNNTSPFLDRAWAEYLNAKIAETILVERAALRGGRAFLANLPVNASREVIAAANGWGVPAAPVIVERVRSHQTAGSTNLLQIPANDETAPAWAWHAALHQLAGIWLTNTYPDANVSTVLAPDGRTMDNASFLKTAIESLRAGAGALLERAAPAVPTIAVYENVQDEASVQNFAALFRFLESGGFQYDLVNDAEIPTTTDPYQLLILPAALYLPESTVDALDSYVANGGRLLADAAPATLDQWGDARNGSPGAGWFTNPAEETQQPHSLLLGVLFDEALTDADTARRLRAWLNDVGLQSVDETARRNSIDFSGERFAYTFGRASIIAYSLPPYIDKDSERFRVGLDKDAFAYNLVDQEPLISGNWSVARVTKELPALFSLLPYEVTRLVLSAPESVVAGQRLAFDVVVKTKADLPGSHLVHARVTAGLDKVLPHYDQIIECPNGQGSGYIPVAFNELPITYSLEVRDILSGTRAIHEFTVLASGN